MNSWSAFMDPHMYLCFKALHVVSFICWMAALLYLPRLFVYHTKSAIGSESYKTFLIMESKLIKYIMTPSMISSFASGIILLTMQDIGLWFHFKGLALLLLVLSHIMFMKYHRDFQNQKNQRSERFFRISNEVPSLLMIIIVLMAIFKPS